MKKGLFIVLDGPDGCGKTTQAELLAGYLKTTGQDVMHLREPGGTSIGEKVRNVLLDPANSEMCVQTELFLYMASRAQLVDEVITPALEAGKVVVTERFISSSVVYQGIAGGLGRKNVDLVGKIACGGLRPDLLVILDIGAREGLVRIKRGLDRMESKQLSFHDQVSKGFRSLARMKNIGRVALIPSIGSRQAIHAKIRTEVEDVIERRCRAERGR